MTVAIPSTGTQTFVIPPQQLSELRRLLQSGQMTPSLGLDFVRDHVTFFNVRVLQVIPAPSAGDVDLIAVTLKYESRVVGAGDIFGGMMQMQQNDDANVQAILKQMQADNQSQMSERRRIMQNLQTQIFQMTQDVTVNKAKSADKAFKAMSDYIRS